jgi:hypothetical protein
VIQEISTIRDLQDKLRGKLIQLDQVYDQDDQQQKSIISLNNRMSNTVKITNKVEESKLEIKDVDSNSSTNGKIITIPFNEEIPSKLKERVAKLEKKNFQLDF